MDSNGVRRTSCDGGTGRRSDRVSNYQISMKWQQSGVQKLKSIPSRMEVMKFQGNFSRKQKCICEHFKMETLIILFPSFGKSALIVRDFWVKLAVRLRSSQLCRFWSDPIKSRLLSWLECGMPPVSENSKSFPHFILPLCAIWQKEPTDLFWGVWGSIQYKCMESYTGMKIRDCCCFEVGSLLLLGKIAELFKTNR